MGGGGVRVRTSAGLEGVGTEGKDVGGEAGLEERGFVGRHSGGGGLGASGHRSSNFLIRFLDCRERYTDGQSQRSKSRDDE